MSNIDLQIHRLLYAIWALHQIPKVPLPMKEKP